MPSASLPALTPIFNGHSEETETFGNASRGVCKSGDPALSAFPRSKGMQLPRTRAPDASAVLTGSAMSEQMSSRAEAGCQAGSMLKSFVGSPSTVKLLSGSS
eukprot:6904299-Alexandrium_andersonii.AAC.1